MKQSYYIFTSGTLKKKDNSLTLLVDEDVKKDIPIERINDLYIFSEITYNSKLFNFLSSKEVIVHMFNYYGYYMGTFYPREKTVSGKLLIKQVEKNINFEERLLIAKSIIKAASYNIYRNLRYYNNRGRNLEDYMTKIQMLRGKIDKCKRIEELMGIEGNIRKTYYSSWNIIINKNIEFQKRIKRPPEGVVNSLISFLNSILYTKVLSEIYKTQLNPTVSYLHEACYKRFSLALDMAEIFKPLLVDRTIFSMLNKGIIDESDFSNDTLIRLKDKALKKIMQEFENTLTRKINHKTLNRKTSYKYLIRLELYKLIKHILDEQKYEGFKIWW